MEEIKEEFNQKAAYDNFLLFLAQNTDMLNQHKRRTGGYRVNKAAKLAAEAKNRAEKRKRQISKQSRRKNRK